jgi:hypothetical protein
MKKKPMKRGKKIVKKSRKTYKKKGGIDFGMKKAYDNHKDDIEFNNKGFKITIQRAFGTEEENIFNGAEQKFANAKNKKTEVIDINPVNRYMPSFIIEDIRKFQIKHTPDGEEVKLDDINEFIKKYPYYMKKNKFGIGEFHKVLNIKHFNNQTKPKTTKIKLNYGNKTSFEDTELKNTEEYIIEIPKA